MSSFKLIFLQKYLLDFFRFGRIGSVCIFGVALGWKIPILFRHWYRDGPEVPEFFIFWLISCNWQEQIEPGHQKTAKLTKFWSACFETHHRANWMTNTWEVSFTQCFVLSPEPKHSSLENGHKNRQPEHDFPKSTLFPYRAQRQLSST